MNTTHPILAGALIVTGMFSPGLSAAPASPNYQLPWSVLDSGGTVSASANYQLAGSLQGNVGATASSPNYVLSGGFHSPPDSDGDTLRDFVDNCIEKPNPNQRDTDNDGIGNWCDPDFDNNGIVNAADLAFFKTKFFTTDPDADLTGDGIVNAADLAILKAFFFKAPGPSGLK